MQQACLDRVSSIKMLKIQGQFFEKKKQTKKKQSSLPLKRTYQLSGTNLNGIENYSLSWCAFPKIRNQPRALHGKQLESCYDDFPNVDVWLCNVNNDI